MQKQSVPLPALRDKTSAIEEARRDPPLVNVLQLLQCEEPRKRAKKTE